MSSMQYVGVAVLLLGTALAVFQRTLFAKPISGNSIKPPRKTTPPPTASAAKLSTAKLSTAKLLAHKIASTIIAEESLTSIPDEEIMQLMDMGIQLLDEEPARVSVRSPCYVFGDIHGNLHYFLKFFSHANVEPQLLKLHPPQCNLLFLGDYVDRGKCSLEVIALLVSLKLLFRDKVTLLRGNHEILGLNIHYTFQTEVTNKRGKSGGGHIYKKCNKLFTKLPLCAIISKTFLCMHGGLPRPEGWDFLMGDDFRKPTDDQEIYTNNTFNDLLWADPTNNSQELRLSKDHEPDSELIGQYGKYCYNKLCRTSIFFNDLIAQEFFNRFQIGAILRGHRFHPKGHELNEAHTICTIHSSVRYEAQTDCGSVLRVSSDLKHMQFITLKPKVEE